MLFSRNVIKDPRTFYCPSQNDDQFTWPDGWNLFLHDGTAIKRIGYSYRLCNQAAAPHMTDADIKALLQLKMGKFKGYKALTSDIVGPRGQKHHWPHVKPYAINVGFSDGHCESIQMTQLDYDLSYKLPHIGAADGYQYHMFKGFDTRDFTYVRTKLRF